MEEKNKSLLIVKNTSVIRGIMFFLLLTALIYSLSNYLNFSFDNDPDSNKNGLAFQFSPWEKLKNYFEDSRQDDNSSKIKIVQEESQVIEVVDKASPAVVSIVASAEVPKYEQCFKRESFFPGRKGFSDFGYEVPSWCQNGTEIQRVGAGTGFIVSSDGYILTNRHVVEDEQAEYTVILNDVTNLGKKFKAAVLARDIRNDIAILKIESKDLPFLEFGNSDKIRVGQTAITIGFSLGEFQNTVSKGVVSGLSRTIVAGGFVGGGSELLHDLIQTDAAINPGNSGGPLLDISGKVIGMNVAMADAQSISFAIPINRVGKTYEEVKTTGKLSIENQAYLGIRYIPINEEIQKQRKLPFDYGVILLRGELASEVSVMDGSPAEKAGLAEGDLILEINGKRLSESYLLSDAIEDFNPGDKITLKIYKNGQEKIIDVALGKRS